MGFVLAADKRERYAFWLAVLVSYGILAALATTEGIGYTLHESFAPHERVVTPEYSAVLWLPAVVLGADGWGPVSWYNTLYWITVAGLAGKSLALLDRRLRAVRRAPSPRDPRVPVRDPPGRPAGHPLPASGDAPPAPPRAGSGP